METKNLQIRQISDAAYHWYLEYLTVLDRKDVEAYGAYLADDCVMVQNNQLAVQGKAAILEGLRQYWQSFGSLTHDLLNIFGDDHAFVLEAWNHYTRLDGKAVSVRAVAITERNAAQKVTRVALYTDVSPSFA